MGRPWRPRAEARRRQACSAPLPHCGRGSPGRQVLGLGKEGHDVTKTRFLSLMILAISVAKLLGLCSNRLGFREGGFGERAGGSAARPRGPRLASLCRHACGGGWSFAPPLQFSAAARFLC